jgi:hypothetical protein
MNTEFHKSLHYPGNPALGYNNPANHLRSPFLYSFDKSTWYQHVSENLNSTFVDTSDNSDVIYTANSEYHGLSYIVLSQYLPTIVLNTPKKNSKIIRYEGKWIDNIGSNIVQTLTPTYFDLFSEAMMTNSERNSYYEELGSNQELGIVTPSQTVNFHIPIFYSLFQTTYFPLYLFGYNDKLSHNLSLERNIENLYQIYAIYQDGTRELVPVSSKTIESIDGESYNKSLLSLPVLLGKYFNFTPEEYNYMIINRPKSYFFNDIKYIKSNEFKKKGESIVLDIPKDVYPHTYMWVARNSKGHSNYQSGDYSPTSETIFTLNNDKTQTITYNESQRIHPFKHFPSKPSKPGYNYWCNGFRARDNYPIPENQYSKIEVKLSELNPFTKIKNDLNQVPNDDSFSLEVLLLFTKKIVFDNFPKTEEERKSMRTKITISS